MEHQRGAANAIFEYIEAFHNRRRRHSALDWQTPIEFENTIRNRAPAPQIQVQKTGWVNVTVKAGQAQASCSGDAVGTRALPASWPCRRDSDPVRGCLLVRTRAPSRSQGLGTTRIEAWPSSVFPSCP